MEMKGNKILGNKSKLNGYLWSILLNMYFLNIAFLMKMALDAPTIPFAKFNMFVH
jgi:hypothetical protein